MKLSFPIPVLSLVARMAVPCNAAMPRRKIRRRPTVPGAVAGIGGDAADSEPLREGGAPTWSVGKNGELANVRAHLKANGPENSRGWRRSSLFPSLLRDTFSSARSE